MYKFLFSFVVSMVLSLNFANALSVFKLLNDDKDLIDIKYLPKYIKSIFDSHAQFIENKITHLKDDKLLAKELGLAGQDKKVFILNKTSNKDANDHREIDFIINYYNGQLSFFKQPFFVVPIDEAGTLETLDITKLSHLELFYSKITGIASEYYDRLHNMRTSLLSMSESEALIPAVCIYDEEAGMRDLIKVIQACRSHLRKAAEESKLRPVNLKYFNESENVIRKMATQDAIEIVNKIFSTFEMWKAWRKGVHAYEEREKKKATDILVNSNNAIMLNESMSNEKAAIVSTIPTDAVVVEAPKAKEQPTDTPTKGKRKKKRNKKRSGTTASLSITPAAAENNRQKPIAHPVRNSQQDETPQPTLQSLQANLKGEKSKKVELPTIKEKIKTRPDETKTALRSLNGLFNEKETAFEKAKKKLKNSASDSSSESSSSSSSSSAHLGKTEHTRRLKTLRKLIGSDGSKVNVSKTLTILEYFGLIKSTNTGHQQMKTKTVDMWLNGERTLIELSPATTIAVAHKSGSKSYFKPYVVKRIKETLVKAGFDKLLQK